MGLHNKSEKTALDAKMLPKPSLPVITRSVSYVYLCDGTNERRLSDDAAASTAAASPIGVNGSGGGVLGLGSLGGNGEERSEEIH
jgi:hypothetical protein